MRMFSEKKAKLGTDYCCKKGKTKVKYFSIINYSRMLTSTRGCKRCQSQLCLGHPPALAKDSPWKALPF